MTVTDMVDMLQMEDLKKRRLKERGNMSISSQEAVPRSDGSESG